MLKGKSPSSNNYQKLYKKIEMRECLAKHLTDNKKTKSNQSVKVLKTLIQNKEQSFRSYMKEDLVT